MPDIRLGSLISKRRAIRLTLFLVSFNGIFVGSADAETLIGCLFSPSVCAPQTEWCYDDMAFGRCLPVGGPLTADDMKQYSLRPRDLASLEGEMQRLYSLGYRWDQLYTQCVLQALLRQIAEGSKVTYDRGGCDESFPEDVKTLSFMDPLDDIDVDGGTGTVVTGPGGTIADAGGEPVAIPITALLDQDDGGSPRGIPAEGSPLPLLRKTSGNDDTEEAWAKGLRLLSSILDDPRYLASVRFTPSALNPHSSFADEVYSPPGIGVAEPVAGGSRNAKSGPMGSGGRRPSSLLLGSSSSPSRSRVVRPSQSSSGSIVLGPPVEDFESSLPMNVLKQELIADAGSLNRADGASATVEDLLRLAAGIGSSDVDFDDLDLALPNGGGGRQQQEPRQQLYLPLPPSPPAPQKRRPAAAAAAAGVGGRMEKRVLGIEPNVARNNRNEDPAAAVPVDYDVVGGGGGIPIGGGNGADLSASMEEDLNYFDTADDDDYATDPMTRSRKGDSGYQKNFNNFFRDVLLAHDYGDPSGAIDLNTLWQSRKLSEDSDGEDDDPFLDDGDADDDGGISGTAEASGYGNDNGNGASAGASESSASMYADGVLPVYVGGGGNRDFFLPDGGVLDLSLAGKDMISSLDEEGDSEMLSPVAQKPSSSQEDGPYQRLERMDVKKPGPEFDPRIPPDPPKHHHKHPQLAVEDLGEDRPTADDGGAQEMQQHHHPLHQQQQQQQQSAVHLAEDPSSPRRQHHGPYGGGEQQPRQRVEPEFLGGEAAAADNTNKLTTKHDILLREQQAGEGRQNGGHAANDERKERDEAQALVNAGKHKYFRKDQAFLQITKPFTNLEEGEKVVSSLERLLALEPGTFTDVKVKGKQVMFKVNPNSQRLNVTDIINGAEQFRDAIKNDVDVLIESGGMGDELKITWKDYRTTRQERILLIALTVVASVAALMAAGLMVYVIRRYYKRSDKLFNLSKAGDSEASRDYQDLCRARMATKSQEKSEPLHKIITGSIRDDSGSHHQGVTGSPHSSRSSTSSWTEEPVASNMDISTGHMVLSYMEDHLKNKDKLEQEWLSLCAYEADPCSTTTADRAENQKRNRDKKAVPYDHARVILNDLSNISGSDYINASTITDHDPRNPAYIACQGPTAGTAADFWQMVWEQGSVVIVMLTKLTENGTAMCHRYWPEEGSEVYHIYEVHLVSEHIWCEDYLVRSFYLKNLKTGETRTVTQFHFLSWPVDGVPNSTRALLEFRRKVNKSYRGRSCPIIVHCNDGSGRTGTYCLIDMVLNRMAKGAKEIDIAATLEHIRDQRPGTVKTRGQFEFVLMAVAEEVHAILKAMPQ